MPDRVEIDAYDPLWPGLFEREKGRLESLFKDDNIVAVEHFGSTAVSGLSAKPIIDIMLVVKSFAKAKENYIPLLKQFEYVYWPEDPKRETRMFFVKGMPPFGKQRTHHIHVVQENNREFLDRLEFCHYLRSHPQDAKEYEVLKIRLSQLYPDDRDAYTEAKSSFIQTIMTKIRRS